MDRGLAVLLTAAVGGLIAMQPAVNSGLGRETGSLAAALVSFTVGTIVLAAIVVVAGQAGGLRATFDAGPVYLIGGLLGAAYVTMAIFAVREIGAGGVAAATITGQLTFSVLLDRFGVLGLEQTPITPSRVAGIALLLTGTWLIIR
jgi:bacterial/archaeal transporter family-2 protein